LEVHRITGRPISSFHREHGLAEAPFEVLFIVITAPRPELYDRIARRTEAMFRQGLVDEVKSLIDRGYHRDLKSMRSIGYRETAALIDGEIDTAEAKNRIVTNTRRLAKRQLTWFRAQPGVVWAGIDQTERVDRLVQDFWTADGAD
jgi:tRNA dimethylallyltransferase